MDIRERDQRPVTRASRRRASARVRRRRRTATVGVLLVVGLAAWLVSRASAPSAPASGNSTLRTGQSTSGTGSPGSGSATGSGAGGGTAQTIVQTAAAPAAAHVTTALEPWHLPNPVSREGTVAAGKGHILILGGLTAAGTSSTEVALLDTASGKLTAVGSLAAPTHDAGTTVLGGRAVVFGGGQSTATTAVQAFPLAAGTGSTAAVTGQLPVARADDEAVTVGGTAYVLGGYDGAGGDVRVLATTNGTTFTPVATLPAAVRYPAVVAAHGRIYVFGGEVLTGGSTLEIWTPTTQPPPAQQVPVVQVVNPTTHQARVVGTRLPRALEGAAAFVLHGHIYLAGGDSFDPSTSPVSDSTICLYNPANGTCAAAGHLANAVSNAGVVVIKTTAWLVGGEHNGAPVGTVQRVHLAAKG